ncbi:unnamed protein product [Plutella xylostella]|uniref:(diamondback moth) hypothetical protein n=1 Tax=Plutella xylostella TaxID=51655 RepID=A0A8S4G1F6_PLUXY|nr:unnamed protein product [Plutella xylostella]
MCADAPCGGAACFALGGPTAAGVPPGTRGIMLMGFAFSNQPLLDFRRLLGSTMTLCLRPPCADAPCGGAACFALGGAYRCGCPAGYAWDNAHGVCLQVCR